MESELKQAWERNIQRYGNPRMPEPRVVGGKATACINLTDKRIDISGRFVEQLEQEGMARTDAYDAILEHEVGHHMYCPRDLTNSLVMFNSVQRAIPHRDKGIKWKATNMFQDVECNTNAVLSNPDSHLPQLYTTMHRQGMQHDVMVGLYQWLWQRDMGVPAEGKILEDLKTIPYQDKDSWPTSAARFAKIVDPILPNMPEDDGCGHEGTKGFTEEEKREAMKKVAKRLSKGGFKKLFEELEEEFGDVVKRDMGDQKTPQDGDALFYMRLAENYRIEVADKGVATTGGDYPHAHAEWGPSDPSGDIDAFSSFGKTGMPGVTKRWLRKENEGYVGTGGVPDALIMIDSSDSMKEENKFHHAVLSAGCSADAYLRRGREVAVFNFSDTEIVTPFTRRRADVYRGLVPFIGGNTKPDMKKLKRLEGRREPDVLMITDMGLQNAEDVVNYAAGSANRMTVVSIGGDASEFASKVPSEKLSVFSVQNPADIGRIVAGSTRKIMEARR